MSYRLFIENRKKYLLNILALFLCAFAIIFLIFGKAFGVTKILESSDKDIKSINYPAIVVGDEEVGLLSIARNVPVSDRPIIFFSKNHDTDKPLILLKLAKTVIFQEGGTKELALDLLPRSGQQKNKNIIRLSNLTRESITVSIPSTGKFSIFYKVIKGKKKGFIKINNEKYKQPQVERMGRGLKKSLKGRWTDAGAVHFSKGKHRFESLGNVEEIIVVAEKKFKKHYNQVTKLIRNKTIGTLFQNDQFFRLWTQVETPSIVYTPRAGRYNIFYRVTEGQSKNFISIGNQYYKRLFKSNRISQGSKKSLKKVWRDIGIVRLSRGKHLFESLQNVEEIIVVAEKKFNTDYKNVSKLLAVQTIDRFLPNGEVNPKTTDFELEIANKPTKFDLDKQREAHFVKINPTKYIVSINSKKSPWLVLSETYHPEWKAYLGKVGWWQALWRKPIAEKYHFKANGYANAWHIQKSGHYNITLYYRPQSLFNIGLMISSITLLGCIGYLSYDWIRSRGQMP